MRDRGLPKTQWCTVSELRRGGVGLIVVAALLFFGMSACASLPRAPVRAVPTPLPELAFEIIEMPEMVCIGDVATFVIKTKPGNECTAAVSYINTTGTRKGQNLESMVSDEEGLCRWTWRVADDAVVGIARFDAGVRGYGHLESLLPQPFEIEDCGR
jgi:hypothetical protein